MLLALDASVQVGAGDGRRRVYGHGCSTRRTDAVLHNCWFSGRLHTALTEQCVRAARCDATGRGCGGEAAGWRRTVRAAVWATCARASTSSLNMKGSNRRLNASPFFCRSNSALFFDLNLDARYSVYLCSTRGTRGWQTDGLVFFFLREQCTVVGAASWLGDLVFRSVIPHENV